MAIERLTNEERADLIELARAGDITEGDERCLRKALRIIDELTEELAEVEQARDALQCRAEVAEAKLFLVCDHAGAEISIDRATGEELCLECGESIPSDLKSLGRLP